MTYHPAHFVRSLVLLLAFSLIAACSGPQETGAAPFAAHVMDARTGETLYSENADARLHPASLTKMLTLYIAFQEIEQGRLSLDSMITVSKNAAAQPPSRLGLKAGQKIELRYLIRAAAVKSANDAASAIGDHISGSQEKFASRMTRTAKSLGMRNSAFRNANGLTAKGHLSTAEDMSILGRHLFYDFPQYYNIFSRRTTDAGLATVASTNRRFLDAYPGADGIKTGFTNAAGYNLTASAERDGVRIIATVFGGASGVSRNAKMADLLDIGFRKAPSNVPKTRLAAPLPAADAETETVADLIEEEEEGEFPAKTIRLQLAVKTSPRPLPRPQATAAVDEMTASLQDGIAMALAEATAAPPPEGTLEAQALDIAAAGSAIAPDAEAPLTDLALAEPQGLVVTAKPALKPVQLSSVPRPPKRNAPIFDSPVVAEAKTAAPEVVTRLSTSGGRHWGISLGRYGTESEATKLLMRMQLAENATLGQGLRKVLQKKGGFDANIMGLTPEQADLACRKLADRMVPCFTLGP